MDKNQKPLGMLIEELKKNISDDINMSQLHPYILGQIMKEFYMEIHQIYIQQSQIEKESYEKSLMNTTCDGKED